MTDQQTQDLTTSQELKESIAKAFSAGWRDVSDEALEIFTEDLVFGADVLPVPIRFVGREQIRRVHKAFAEAIPDFWQKPEKVHPTTDPDVLILEASGGGQVAGGGAYSQRYLYIMRLRDGQIAEVDEYLNGYKLAEAMGWERLEAALAEITA